MLLKIKGIMNAILVEKKKNRFPLKKLRREEKLSTKKNCLILRKGWSCDKLKNHEKKLKKLY